MSIWVSLFIADLINELVVYDIFKRLNNIKQPIKFKNIIVCTLLALMSATLLNSVKLTINFFVKLGIIIFAFKYMSKLSLPKTLISVIITYIVLVISEMLVVLFVLGILGIDVNANSKWLSILSFNIGIIAICFLIFKIPKVLQLAQGIVKWYYEKYVSYTIVVLIVTLCPLYFFLIKNTNLNMNTIDYIVNAAVIACLTVFVIVYLKQNEDKNKIIRRYDNLLDYAKTYEQEIVEKSKWQHEYENQLLIIKDKISEKNKVAHQYIDELLENRPVNGNSQWLGKLSKFPDIGIKGLLCYKIDQMQAKGINVFVDVADDIQIKKKHSQLLEKNLQDISRILGVYIDNAMDASSKSKNKYLIFEVNCIDDEIIFQISNTFPGSIDLQKIGTEKYSTKGKGHGYGLSLVNDILDKNSLLKQEREINGMYYVQRLIICIKK